MITLMDSISLHNDQMIPNIRVRPDNRIDIDPEKIFLIEIRLSHLGVYVFKMR